SPRPARQALAPVNTSSGPVTSRLCTWSNRTISTVRMPLSLAGPDHGSNDENPTFPAMSGLCEIALESLLFAREAEGPVQDAGGVGGVDGADGAGAVQGDADDDVALPA